MSRPVNLYIAMSLDGYIAKHDGNIDFLNVVDTPGEDFGYSEFSATVDTMIWGRKTYDKVLTFGDAITKMGKKIYVISRTKSGDTEYVTFRSDLVGLLTELQSQEGLGIYCDGGAEIVHELLRHKLLDRVIVSVIPYLLGDGIRLFKEGFPEQQLKFKKSQTFPTGLVQVWYDVEKE